MTTLLCQEYPSNADKPTFKMKIGSDSFCGLAPGDIKEALDWAITQGVLRESNLFASIETDLISVQADSFGWVGVEWL